MLRAFAPLSRSRWPPCAWQHLFGILSIALHLVHDATERPPGGPGPVFLAGDLLGFVDDDARGLGRRFP